MAFFRPIPENTKIPFMGMRAYTFAFSVITSIAAVVLFFMIGLNTGIDFKGGILIEVRTHSGAADMGTLRETLEDLDLGEVQLQNFGQPSDVLIRVGLTSADEEEQQEKIAMIQGTLEESYEFRRVEVVGPSVSAELVNNGVLGVGLAFVGILIYLWFRFEWQFAVGAVIATLHDILLTIGFFVIFQLDFDLSAVAALLTILGYSLNDTVVVYDRIREILRRYKKMPLPEMIDLAINSTLSRTILTSITTLLAVMCLVIWGGPVVKSFSLAMAFGIIAGTYSSIFIAAPVLIFFGLKTQGQVEQEAAQQTP